MDDGAVYKKDWVLTKAAFEKLLKHLDSDPDRAGDKFLELRKRLLKFFEYNRCGDPDGLVDITIDRAARRIEEGVEVRDLTSYVTTVARFVLKEQWVSPERKMQELEEEVPPSALETREHEDEEEKLELERRLECLEKCAGELVPAERQRVIDYYCEQGRAKIDNRKQMAEEMRVTASNLRVKMHRTRERLEICIIDCLKVSKKQI